MGNLVKINFLFYGYSPKSLDSEDLADFIEIECPSYEVRVKTALRPSQEDLLAADIIICGISNFLLNPNLNTNPRARLFVLGSSAHDESRARIRNVNYLFCPSQDVFRLEFQEIIETYLSEGRIEKLKFKKYAKSTINTSVHLN